MALFRILGLMAALTLALTGGLFAGPVNAGQAATKTFSISIDGSAGVRVVAACLVDWGDEADVVTLKGEVPLSRKVEAVGLACQVKKLGRSGKLVIEVRRNGRVVSRNASSGSSSIVSFSLQ